LAMLAVGYAPTMSDSTVLPLLHAADRLADRFRSMPQTRLAALAPEGLLLARQLVRRTRELEGGAGHGELPEAGIFAVGDQIALAAHDLAAALAAESGPDGGDTGESGDSGEGRGTAARLLAESLADLAAVYRLATTRSARM
jgi:hypothetical protein